MYTILAVDDTPEYLMLLSKLLESKYQVITANSGRLGLELAVDEPRPDLILLDVMMPELNGYDVIKQLKANPLTAKIPVIFISALENSVDEEHGLALGAVDYIAKPFKPAILLKQIKSQQDKKERAAP